MEPGLNGGGKMSANRKNPFMEKIKALPSLLFPSKSAGSKNQGKPSIKNGTLIGAMLMLCLIGNAFASHLPEPVLTVTLSSPASQKEEKPVLRLPVSDSKRLAFYDNRLFIVDKNGTLWETERLDGKNKERTDNIPQSAQSSSDPPAKTIVAKPQKKHIIMVSADSGIFVIDETGILWELEEIHAPDQQAISDKNIVTSEKNAVKILDNVRDVTANGSPHFAIKNDNTLWTWGASDEKRADDHRDTLNRPRKILDHVREIVDSDYRILALKEDGTLWSWGKNQCGGLGNGILDNIQTRPRPLDMSRFKGKRIISMTAFKEENYVLTEDNTIWYWGEDITYKPYCMGNSVTLPTASRKKISQKLKRLYYLRNDSMPELYALGSDDTFYRLENAISLEDEKDTESTDYLDPVEPEPLWEDVDQYISNSISSAFMLKNGTVWIENDILYEVVFVPEKTNEQ